jgi:multiple sugar transport system permease protein
MSGDLTRLPGARVAGLVGPAVLLLATLILIPTCAVIVLAFFEWDLGDRAIHFAGLGNFIELFHDDLFWASLNNTLLFSVVVVPVTLGLGLALAILIEQHTAFRTFYRSVHLLPVLAAFPAMAMAWELLLHPTVGPLNEALRTLGVTPPNWLRDRELVLPTFMVIGVWQYLGIAVVLFIGGLKSIPQDLYDAAEVDGATRPLDRFLTVTLPGLGPVFVFVTTLIGLRGLEVFDMPRVLTHGGPGYASETLLHTLFVESFVYLRTGFGAALTVIFLGLALVLTVVRRLLDRKVHYT